MFHIGMMWLVLKTTGSSEWMGLVGMAGYIPVLFFGLIGGTLADLFDRRRLMLLSDLIRAAIVTFLVLQIHAGPVGITTLLVVPFLLATFGTIFNPSRDAMIPELVGHGSLVRTNSVIQVSAFAAILIGPAIGAGIIASLGLIHVFSVDVFTFLVSALAIRSIRPSTPEPSRATRHSLKGHLREVFAHLNRDRRLTWTLSLTAIQNFFIMGPAMVGTPLFVHEVLKQDAASYAAVESCLGLGMVIGCFLMPKFTRRWNLGRILIVGMIFDGLTHALLPACTRLPEVMIVMAIHALAIPMIVICRTSLVQQWSEGPIRGRIFSLVNISVVGMTALSSGVVGWLAARIPVPTIFLIFGIGAALCGVIGWVYRPLREA